MLKSVTLPGLLIEIQWDSFAKDHGGVFPVIGMEVSGSFCSGMGETAGCPLGEAAGVAPGPGWVPGMAPGRFPGCSRLIPILGTRTLNRCRFRCSGGRGRPRAKLPGRVMPRKPALAREFQLDLRALAFSTPNREG